MTDVPRSRDVVDIPSRRELRLDGPWEVRLDPDETGLLDQWQAPGVAFDHRVTVPGAWQAAGPELARYAGPLWYRRSFELPRAWPDGHAVIGFGAVDHDAHVWLNGIELGRHEGGYLPFEVPVDGALHPGRNELVVLVEDAPGRPDRTRGKQGGVWYTPTSGIWQPVTLTVRPPEYIGSIRCLPRSDGEAVSTAGMCHVRGERKLLLELFDAAGHLVATHEFGVAPDATTFAFDIPVIAARPWEPGDPHLYTMAATLLRPDAGGGDRYTTRFGMRTVSARDGQIWLNGHRQEIRGALDQAYWPATLYSPPSSEAVVNEIRRAKALGFNLMRKHIKVEDPRALDAADEMGMLIWAEPPNPARFTRESAGAVRRDLLGMIERDANHPSVVIWGCYNEDWGIEHLWNEPERQSWLANLVNEVRALDPSRLVCDNSGWAHVSTDLNDYHEYFSLPERASAFEARLDEIELHPDDNFAAGHAAKGEPALVSEIGAWMISDPDDLRTRLGGRDPSWFDHASGYQRGRDETGPGPGDPLPAIATVHGFAERLVRAGLDRVFASPADVVAHAQRRGARSIAEQLGGLRRRRSLAGYVVTELTDTEWEANGWLDQWREPKPAASHLAASNAPVAIVARPSRRTVFDGAGIELDLVLVNDTPDALIGGRIVIDGKPAEADTGLDPIAPYSRVAGLRVSWVMPPGPTASIDLTVALEVLGVCRAETTVELARVEPADLAHPVVRATGPTLCRIFRQRLERHGYRMPRDWDAAADVAIVHRLDDRVLEFADAGGHVLCLLGDLIETPDPLGFRYRELAHGESWEMHTGVAWARSELLRPAPVRPDIGWEAAAWFPNSYVLADSLESRDVQLAGWFEGWAAFAGAFALMRAIGQGRVLATTFQLSEWFGVDPVATLLLDRFVELLGEPLDASPPHPGWAGIGNTR